MRTRRLNALYIDRGDHRTPHLVFGGLLLKPRIEYPKRKTPPLARRGLWKNWRRMGGCTPFTHRRYDETGEGYAWLNIRRRVAGVKPRWRNPSYLEGR